MGMKFVHWKKMDPYNYIYQEEYVDFLRMEEMVHEALVRNNLNEFNHSGYDAMAKMCETDHQVILL